MRREVIGDCSDDLDFGEYETELVIKYLKRCCGPTPRGVDIEVTWEGYELATGDETQYPVICVVWDDGVADDPDEYICKGIEAFERFELPNEIHRVSRHRR